MSLQQCYASSFDLRAGHRPFAPQNDHAPLVRHVDPHKKSDKRHDKSRRHTQAVSMDYIKAAVADNAAKQSMTDPFGHFQSDKFRQSVSDKARQPAIQSSGRSRQRRNRHQTLTDEASAEYRKRVLALRSASAGPKKDNNIVILSDLVYGTALFIP